MKLSADGKTLLRADDSDIKKDGSFDIPQGVTAIGDNAFKGLRRLRSLIIPEGVTFIGNQAFYLCTSLCYIGIPQGVKSIGSFAFWGCLSMQAIIIAEGSIAIGRRAFGNCPELQSITLPKGLVSMGDGVFSQSKSLRSIMVADANNEAEVQAVARLLPKDLTDKIISLALAEAIAQVRKAQLSRVAQTLEINPLYRYFNSGSEYVSRSTGKNEAGDSVDKECSKLPNDIFKHMNPFLLSENPYYQKAKKYIFHYPLPENHKQLREYENTLKNIADKCMQKAKAFSQYPVKLQRENQPDEKPGLEHLAMITPASPLIALAAIAYQHVTGKRFSFFQSEAQRASVEKDLREEHQKTAIYGKL